MVCDASTLIALARIGQLDILPQVGAQVVIPRAVYEEVVVRGAGKPGSDEIRQASWIETREVADRDVVAQFRTVLDTGESEAITLAKEIGADLIILDDEDARDAALSEGLDVVGLLAFLVLAKEEGMIIRSDHSWMPSDVKAFSSVMICTTISCEGQTNLEAGKRARL